MKLFSKKLVDKSGKFGQLEHLDCCIDIPLTTWSSNQRKLAYERNLNSLTDCRSQLYVCKHTIRVSHNTSFNVFIVYWIIWRSWRQIAFVIATFKFFTVFRSIGPIGSSESFKLEFDVPWSIWSDVRIPGMYSSLRSSSRTLFKRSPWSIPRSAKSMRAAASLSDRWFVINICPRGWLRLDRRHGTLTAVICLDSVIDEQRPFGAPKSRIRAG